MPDDSNADKTGQIPTNMRLLLLLEEVARAGRPTLPATLGAALGLPKPTIHRLLATAEDEGFLQRDIDGRSYGPGPRLRKLSANTLSSERIRTERLRILTILAEDVGETCNLATPGRNGMIYLDRVETHWPLRIQLPRGTQVPFHCTASGKLYLASLRADKLARIIDRLSLEASTDRTITDPTALLAACADTRARGYSTDNQEFMDSMAAIAVPINDDQGRLLTTLSIHAPVQRGGIPELEKHLRKLQDAATELSGLLDA